MTFFIVTLLPPFLASVVSPRLIQSELSLAADLQAQLDEHIIQRVERNFFIQVLMFIGGVFFFCFWCWTKIPHDFGTRYRQSHAANKVCAAQFSLAGRHLYRRAT